MGQLILTADRVLIEPRDGEQQTPGGLLLPATVASKERVGAGRVIRVGPGFLVPNSESSEEPWNTPKAPARFIPLQAKPGDYAHYLRKESIEFEYRRKQYVIVPHGAILALVRPSEGEALEALDDLLDIESA
ncbi:MAG: co-chaperone GroES [Planctomycetota bacterium]